LLELRHLRLNHFSPSDGTDLLTQG